jgi:hypothetical protein
MNRQITRADTRWINIIGLVCWTAALQAGWSCSTTPTASRPNDAGETSGSGGTSAGLPDAREAGAGGSTSDAGGSDAQDLRADLRDIDGTAVGAPFDCEGSTCHVGETYCEEKYSHGVSGPLTSVLLSAVCLDFPSTCGALDCSCLPPTNGGFYCRCGTLPNGGSEVDCGQI